MESLDHYIIRKLIYNIMFDSEYNDYTDCKDLYELNILESLKNIVEYHVKNNELSNFVKNNIFNFLSYGRSIDDEHRNERFEVINNIIVLLNSQKYDYSLNFYAKQLRARRNDKRYLTATVGEVQKEVERMNEAICLDYYIVTSHCNRTDDFEFVKDIGMFINNSIYYECLMMILNENPIVFKDPKFYERIKFILDINKKRSQEIGKLNKELVKRIDTSIKRIK